IGEESGERGKEFQVRPYLRGPSGTLRAFFYGSAAPGEIFEQMDCSLDKICYDIRFNESRNRDKQEEIGRLEKLQEVPFPDMAELDNLRRQISTLTQEIVGTGGGIPLPEDYTDLTERYESNGQLKADEMAAPINEGGDWRIFHIQKEF